MKTDRYNMTYQDDSRSSSRIVAEYRNSIEGMGASGPESSLAAVHFRGGHEELQLGMGYAKSYDPLDRVTGADILGQLGFSRCSFLESSLEQLITMLDDPDVRVVSSAAVALGHRRDARAVPHLTKFISHRDPEVRLGVVLGLTGQTDIRAVSGLIVLTRDQDEEVRSWALLGLGSQIDSDSVQIRDALFQGGSDENDDARGEALLGLAKRGDPRVVALLKKELQRDVVGQLAVRASGEIADSRLFGHLRRLKNDLEFDDNSTIDRYYLRDLDAAIVRCEPDPKTWLRSGSMRGPRHL